MTQKTIEKRSLIVSSIINFIITGAGVWVFMVTNIQALFLDCFFSLIGFISSLLAVVISQKSKKKTKSYPDGLYFLEPLYAILKSLLILTLLIISVISTSTAAFEYFSSGVGQPMNVEPVLPYTVSMVILCFGLSYYNHRQNKKVNNMSTILTAESKSNFIDGLQSLGIGVAIVFLFFIKEDSSFGFLHYTGDFFITTILIIFSLKEPIKLLITSFKELSNGVTNDEVINECVYDVVNPFIQSMPPNTRLDIFKIGMHIRLRISFNETFNEYTYDKYNKIRNKILDGIKKYYDSVDLIFIF